MKKTIKVKVRRKIRAPHRVTRVHKNRKRYSRKGKDRDRSRKEIASADEE